MRSGRFEDLNPDFRYKILDLLSIGEHVRGLKMGVKGINAFQGLDDRDHVLTQFTLDGYSGIDVDGR